MHLYYNQSPMVLSLIPTVFEEASSFCDIEGGDWEAGSAKPCLMQTALVCTSHHAGYTAGSRQLSHKRASSEPG